MGEVINLNQYRKKLEKAKSGQRASENRQQAGRSKRERLVPRSGNNGSLGRDRPCLPWSNRP